MERHDVEVRQMVRTLAIDIETYSEIDLTKCGVYAYTESPTFEIMLFAYSFDDGETQIIDLAQGEKLPEVVVAAIMDDENFQKLAFNSAFERICISKHLGIRLKPEAWACTAVQASMLALPLSLEGVGEVIGLAKSEKKMKEGKELIRFFSIPCKPTKSNGGRTRNLPEHAQVKWELFKSYCIRDLSVEKAIRQKLRNFPIPENELKLYHLDQVINDRGIMVDHTLVNQAVACDLLYKEMAMQKAYELTGLENPNSISQMKGWLEEQGMEVDGLSKQEVQEMIKESDGEVLELLKIRLLISKTSIKKYQAIERCLCSDSRVRGTFQFYGANRSGRWAGRLINLQNLAKNFLPDLELARELVRQGRFEDVELFYESTPNVLSELIRTAFVPREGHRFIVADFSAIEARVLAHLANQEWRIDCFRNSIGIYEASASAMFNVPIEQITKGSPLRQKGKIAELALGYGGGVSAMISMGAIQMGIAEEELQPLVTTWRKANPKITRFWYAVGDAAMTAVKTRKISKVGEIAFECRSGILFITLPSKRKLSYIKPRIGVNRFGGESITYEGIGENRKWMRIETYGAKIVENIVQAASRDLLAEAMLRLSEAGFEIVAHVHDEVIIEAKEGVGSVEEVCKIMAINPPWAKGLPLAADGYECKFYKKE